MIKKVSAIVETNANRHWFAYSIKITLDMETSIWIKEMYYRISDNPPNKPCNCCKQFVVEETGFLWYSLRSFSLFCVEKLIKLDTNC